MTDEGSSGHTQHLPRSPYYNPNRPKAGFCAHRGVLGKKLSWKPARPPPPPGSGSLLGSPPWSLGWDIT